MPAASPFILSSMNRSFIMDEIEGSSDREIFVRSTYEMVYMTSATGIMRSQRRCVIGSDSARIAYQPPDRTSALKTSERPRERAASNSRKLASRRLPALQSGPNKVAFGLTPRPSARGGLLGLGVRPKATLFGPL